jgi:transposase
MGTAVRPAKTSPGPWDAFADVDVFVDEVLAKLEAMAGDGARPLRSGPKPPLAGAALREATMAIWCVCFCGMQWRAIGRLCDIPFGTFYGRFVRWTRLGLWRRLLDRLRRTWRRACGDAPEPSAVVRSIADPVARRRAALTAGSTAEGRSGASKSMLPLIDTACLWRSMSRRRTGMTRKASCRFCAPSPRVASKVQRSAILASGASCWPTTVRRSASPSRRLPADATDGSSRPASAGGLNGPSPG